MQPPTPPFPLLPSLAAAALLCACSTPRYPGESLTTRMWLMPTENQLTKDELKFQAATAAPQTTAESPPSYDTLDAKVALPSDFPERELETVNAKRDLGIVFSGGGNRAAVSALGQVRALTQMGIMKKARYLSCISGGSWFCVPYTYTQMDEYQYLGINPKDTDYWRPDHFNMRPPLLAGSFASRAADARTHIVKTLLSRYGDEGFASRLNAIYLRSPNDTEDGDMNRFFSYNETTRDDIIRRNDGRLKKEDFVLVTHPDTKPFLIASTSISLPDRFRPSLKFAALVEMTPLYTGSPSYRRGSILSARIGGGYVESFAYDSRLHSVRPQGDVLTAEVELPKRSHMAFRSSPRFALSDVMASSGAAPAMVLDYLPYCGVFPRFLHWSPKGVQKKKQSKVFAHADGGAIDNLGVVPLLRRHVRNLIVFVNWDVDMKQAVQSEPPKLTVDIALLFQGQKNRGYGPMAWLTKSEDKAVFCAEDYSRLKSAFEQKWKSGESLIIDDDKPYTTVANSRFGVPPGLQVKILWVFLGGPKCAQKASPGSLTAWLSGIPTAMQSEMTKDEFKNFPTYKTFNENEKQLINLTPEQVSALSHYTSYVVHANESVFQKAAAR